MPAITIKILIILNINEYYPQNKMSNFKNRYISSVSSERRVLYLGRWKHANKQKVRE